MADTGEAAPFRDPGTSAPDSVVCALFDSCDAADGAWDFSAARGYGPQEVSILMTDGTGKALPRQEGVARPAVAGAIRSALGGIAAVLGAVGSSFLIPEFGVIVAGPLARAVSDTARARALEALTEGMRALGLRPDQLERVEHHVRHGGVVLILHPRSERDRADVAAAWRSGAVELLD